MFGSSPSHSSAKFMKNCLLTQKAVLYEDSQLQIGVQHEYKGDQGRMSLYYNNRGSALSGITVTIGNSNGA